MFDISKESLMAKIAVAREKAAAHQAESLKLQGEIRILEALLSEEEKSNGDKLHNS